MAFDRRFLRSVAANVSQLVVFPVHGDSMEPTLPDGTLALVDCSRRELGGGSVYAVRVGELLLVKRLQRLASGALGLLSDGRGYPPEEIAGSDLGSVEIIGRVAWPPTPAPA